MTAQKLLATLKYIDALDRRLSLQATLETIATALANLVTAPAQPTHQGALASALATFEYSAVQLRSSISPSEIATLAEMGGADYFDPEIAGKVKASIQSNAMTPSVARDFVQDLVNRRSGFLTVVRSTIQGLEQLKIRESSLSPGTADLAFLIPRDLFENHLGQFAKELNFINQLMRDFSEATTGQPQSVDLESLSSSTPTITLAAAGTVILAIAKAVNMFLDAWKKVEEIREIRGRLTKMGMKATALDELTEQITTTVDEVVEESSEIILVNYTGDDGRKNELKNALRTDMKRLYAQIERGLTIEFRAEPKNGEGTQVLDEISGLGREMKFPLISNEPMLLGNGEVIDGEFELAKASKKSSHKTTTTTTTTKKSATPKDGIQGPSS